MNAKQIFKDGNLYLEFNDGEIYFDNQQIQRSVLNTTIEDFYDLVECYLIQRTL